MSINRVNLTGNLGADPELRKTQSGMSILNMRVAVNDRRKDPQTGEWGDYCNWIGVVVFGNRAESLANLLRKGSKIGVDGKLRYSEWEKEGNRRSNLEVIADDIELLTPKGQNGSNGGDNSNHGNYSNRGGSAQQGGSQGGYGQGAELESMYQDDIPFGG